MAKKQTKKQSFNFLPIVALACAIVAIVFFLLPFVTYEKESSILGNYLGVTNGELSGFDLAFGGSQVTLFTNADGEVSESLSLATKQVSVVIIALALLVLGVGVVATSITSEKKYKKIVNLVSLGILAVAGILVFVCKDSFVLVNELGDNQAYYSLGVGVILSGVFALLGAGAQLVRVIKE